MLAIRNIICSNRWREDWPKIEAALRTPKEKKTAPAVPQVLSGDEAVVVLLKEKLTDTQTRTAVKPKSNPWRNFKHGKALFQRSSPPKL